MNPTNHTRNTALEQFKHSSSIIRESRTILNYERFTKILVLPKLGKGLDGLYARIILIEVITRESRDIGDGEVSSTGEFPIYSGKLDDARFTIKHIKLKKLLHLLKL